MATSSVRRPSSQRDIPRYAGARHEARRKVPGQRRRAKIPLSQAGVGSWARKSALATSDDHCPGRRRDAWHGSRRFGFGSPPFVAPHRGLSDEGSTPAGVAALRAFSALKIAGLPDRPRRGAARQGASTHGHSGTVTTSGGRPPWLCARTRLHAPKAAGARADGSEMTLPPAIGGSAVATTAPPVCRLHRAVALGARTLSTGRSPIRAGHAD